MAGTGGRAGDDTRREEIGRLVASARPTIEAVIARTMRSSGIIAREDVEDVMSTVTLRLVGRLQDGDPIENLESYVATLTYRTLYDVMRRRFPERTRLKNRLRYLLGHDARFALWSTADGVFCGLRAWERRTDVLEAFTVSRAMASRVMLDRARPHDAVAAVFERAGRPMSLEALVRIAAELWEIVEVRTDAVDERLPSAAPEHAARFEARQFLESLWNEIRLLPQNQRAALLLNLRDPDGVNAVALLLFVGVARIDEVAEVMGMPTEELLGIWDELPLDDRAIAARLGLTRQQVINLRRSARERLARRTAASGGYDGRHG